MVSKYWMTWEARGQGGYVQDDRMILKSEGLGGKQILDDVGSQGARGGLPKITG